MDNLLYECEKVMPIPYFIKVILLFITNQNNI
jgi:hypothetical protein